MKIWNLLDNYLIVKRLILVNMVKIKQRAHFQLPSWKYSHNLLNKFKILSYDVADWICHDAEDELQNSRECR